MPGMEQMFSAALLVLKDTQLPGLPVKYMLVIGGPLVGVSSCSVASACVPVLGMKQMFAGEMLVPNG